MHIQADYFHFFGSSSPVTFQNFWAALFTEGVRLAWSYHVEVSSSFSFFLSLVMANDHVPGRLCSNAYFKYGTVYKVQKFNL